MGQASPAVSASGVSIPLWIVTTSGEPLNELYTNRVWSLATGPSRMTEAHKLDVESCDRSVGFCDRHENGGLFYINSLWKLSRGVLRPYFLIKKSKSLLVAVVAKPHSDR
jgi:hypothetical protein